VIHHGHHYDRQAAGGAEIARPDNWHHIARVDIARPRVFSRPKQQQAGGQDERSGTESSLSLHLASGIVFLYRAEDHAIDYCIQETSENFFLYFLPSMERPELVI